MKTRKLSRTVPVVIFIALVLIALAPIQAVTTETTATLCVQPQTVGPALVPHDTFTINCSVIGVADLFIWQVKLFFDPTMIACTGASYPTDYVFAGKANVPVPPIIDNESGSVMYGCSLMIPETGFTGSGTLCQIGFEVKDFGESSMNYSEPYGEDTFLMDSALNNMPADVENGRVIVAGASQLEMSSAQNVTVSPSGDANMSFQVKIPQSPLADMYREAFFTDPSSVGSGVEVPIPENKTVGCEFEVGEDLKDASLLGDVDCNGKVDMKDIGSVARAFGSDLGNSTGRWNNGLDVNWDGRIDMKDIGPTARNFQLERSPVEGIVEPVRDLFYQSIIMEQAVLYGFETNVVDARVVPWGQDNETRIMLDITCTQLAELVGSDWRINVGPIDENGTENELDYIFTQIQFIQMMLQSSGQQVYTKNWITTIVLPVEANLLNSAELDLDWHIDFGGDQYYSASVTPEGNGVRLEEHLVVTQQNITASQDDLGISLLDFRRFKIDYSMPSQLSQVAKEKETCGFKDDFSKFWTNSIPFKSYTKTWVYSSGSITATAAIKVTPRLNLEWYISWFVERRRTQFTTWLKVTPSVEVCGYAQLAGAYSHTWSAVWTEKIASIYFFVGWVPQWVNLRLTITQAITVEAYGDITVSATATASAWFKAGVRYDSSSSPSWQGIWEHGSGSSFTKAISGKASVKVTPSVNVRLEFLVDGLAGPYAEAIVSEPITITFGAPYNTWAIAVKLKINAGCTFVGWLKRLLSLNDWSMATQEWTLQSWSGTW